MESLFQDLKFASRQLVKERGFFLTTALTLAVCIGANTTIFSVVNSVLLRPLPFSESERLVRMWNAYPGAGVTADSRGSNGVPDYYDRRALTDVFDELAAYDFQGRSLELEGIPQRIRTLSVTPSFFRLLRADAALGRTFTEEEGELGQENVVVLSYALWQQLYGGERSALGAEIRLDGREHTVVGIMPEAFVYLDSDVRLWSPQTFDPERRMQYHSNNFDMVARLAPGVSLQQAQDRVDALNAANLDKMPQLKPLLIDAGFHTPLFFLQDDLVRDIRPHLYLLWGGVAFVLLIGGVNVANLALVRSTARAKELATRCALGAGRGRVVQQLLTETLALTMVGGALGLALGSSGLRALEALGVYDLVPASEVRLDGTVVLFTLALAAGVGVLISAIPVVGILRVRLTAVFREDGRTGTASRGVGLLRKGLVAAQVGLALVLLVGAGLLLSSFEHLLAVDPGFEPEGVATGTVMLTSNRYPEPADRLGFVEESLRRIRALPGVEHAAVTSHVPFGGGFSDSVIFAEGYVMKEGESAISPTQVAVSDEYFQAMGIALREGRLFDSRDSVDSRPVILIDERLAARFWPNGDALGKRMWMPGSAEDMMNPETADYFDIVGIVESIQMRGLTSSRDQVGMYYFPMSQSVRRSLDFTIKTDGDPNALVGPVRSAISGLDPEMPLFDIRTLSERIDRSVSDRRTPMLLTAGFSVVALLLSAIGIYGMLAYLVQRRTREIGVRVALGSDTAAIFRLILRDGLVVLALGLGLGLGGAVLLRRIIEGQLFGVSALDPRVIGTVLVVLAVVALLACVIPARRATRIEPVRALAQE